MNNSPYLDKPTLSERERAAVDALKAVADFWRDSYPLPGAQPWLDQVRAVLKDFEQP